TLADNRASARVPETSVASATAEGVQLVPLKRKCWPAVGAVAKTLTDRIRATVEALEGPVTSPPSVMLTFVAVVLIFVRPAPLPKKAPTNLFWEFVNKLTPAKLLEPE